MKQMENHTHPLKILYVATEVTPYAKVGGLGDVAEALPKALIELGHDVITAIPAYPMVLNNKNLNITKVVENFTYRLNPTQELQGNLYLLSDSGLKIWLVETGDHFKDCVDHESLYKAPWSAYLYFSRAILECCRQMQWIPDIVNCNDWHTGFIPVLIKEGNELGFQKTAPVFSIHNLGFHREFGLETLSMLGLSRELYSMDKLEAYGHVNAVKAGCVFSNEVNTVSPTYAKELQTEEFAGRLAGLMSHLYREGKFRGILNGINTSMFNPKTDPDIPAHYDKHNLSGKTECKYNLRQIFSLPQNDEIPVIGMVTRLSYQKGFDFLFPIVEEILNMPTQLVVLGLGDPKHVEELKNCEKAFPNQMRYINRFDEHYVRKIYAGSDMFLMPSLYEPCGLGQMIAMRYGTVPVVRKTGGLADTVQDLINGFIFECKEPCQLLNALHRAHITYGQPGKWQEMVHNAISADFSWTRSAHEYIEMYQEALGALS